VNILGRIIGGVVVVSFLLTCLIGLLLLWQWQPMSSKTGSTVQFVVYKGQSAVNISNRLEKDGIIRSKYLFRLWVKFYKLESKLQAGSYKLDPGWTLAKIITTLTQGTDDYWITIPEGWRRQEIAESLVNQELPVFDKTEFLALTEDAEGKLFPDTYLIPKEITTKALVNLLLSTYDKKVVLGLEKQIQAFELRTKKNFKEALILASLVQREARTPAQMKTVAGILWNRLEIGMPLQVDATLQFAKGFDATVSGWWGSPLAADKELDSPYNTYLNPGLPPGAICNPGLAAIQAVLDPTETEALYYLHDGDGLMYTANTLQEHNRNVNTYLRN